jgi:hypothetical protein
MDGPLVPLVVAVLAERETLELFSSDMPPKAVDTPDWAGPALVMGCVTLVER